MSQYRKKPQTPEQFLEQAEEVPTVPNQGSEESAMSDVTTEELPWNSPHMDEITKTFQLRLKMKHLLMLRFISENSPRNVSMQKFCMDVLIPAIEERTEGLMKD